MCCDDETTATQIQTILAAHSVYISLATIICARHQMAGFIEAQHTVSSFVKLIGKNDLNLPQLGYMITLMMPSLVMKQQYNWILSVAAVTGKKEKNLI